MARPQRSRRICHKPRFTMFTPEGSMRDEAIELTREFDTCKLTT